MAKNANLFVNESEALYIGQNISDRVVTAKAHKALKAGDPVKLGKGKKPLEFVTEDAVDGAGGVHGIVSDSIVYDDSGACRVGDFIPVVTDGIVVVPIDASLANVGYAADVFYSDNKYKNTGNAKVGNVSSNVFKARNHGDNNLVDAIYVCINK